MFWIYHYNYYFLKHKDAFMLIIISLFLQYKRQKLYSHPYNENILSSDIMKSLYFQKWHISYLNLKSYNPRIQGKIYKIPSSSSHSLGFYLKKHTFVIVFTPLDSWFGLSAIDQYSLLQANILQGCYFIANVIVQSPEIRLRFKG